MEKFLFDIGTDMTTYVVSREQVFREGTEVLKKALQACEFNCRETPFVLKRRIDRLGYNK